eukprot:SAG22_NODE_1375_length_4557_cov_4.997208_4_plen_70_part_00
MSRGDFYLAAEAAITTTSGVIIFGGRYPAEALQVSYDDGESFLMYMIDAGGDISNGGFVELEPDLILYA